MLYTMVLFVIIIIHTVFKLEFKLVQNVFTAQGVTKIHLI